MTTKVKGLSLLAAILGATAFVVTACKPQAIPIAPAPTPTSTSTFTGTSTFTPTRTNSFTSTPTNTFTSTRTATPTLTPNQLLTSTPGTPTFTSIPSTNTSTPTKTATPTITYTPTSTATLPQPAHIVLVMEENHTYNEVLGAGNSCPYMTGLANGGANMTNSYAITHPSEPNYMALFAGSTESLSSDFCALDLSAAANMGQSLLAAGVSFCGYSEGLPSAGSTVCTSGEYARKHCPWINFQVSGGMPVTCNQPFSAFPSNYNNLPTLSWVIPNLLDDMHDGTPAAADSWLQTNLGAYATYCQTASNNSLLIVQWDEDDSSGPNLIPTIIYGAGVVTGKYSETITHYNLLSTILAMYGISNSTFNSASGAATIRDIF